MNPEKRREIFSRLRAANPHPKSELDYRTPYELLVAVVLSAQATDKSVNLATAKLFPAAHTPRAIAALEALPGVGRKTANVVLNVAFDEPTIAVDTHIFRVANRTGLAPGKDPLEVEERLLKFTPEEFRRHAHHWLILHGRYVCVARKPKCPQCAIRDLCEFRGKTRDA